ncbi:MAG TPA: tetratricopeptide repeat protein [Anaerolineae bacterium]|nr:tetratricopeptide repeat protein [Anaerolineae bacterium]
MAEQEPRPEVDQVVGRYVAALQALDGARPRPEALLAALLARDGVAACLDAVDRLPERVNLIAGLDAQLRLGAARVTGAGWSAWRHVVGAPDSHWWWRLDEEGAKEAAERSTPWLFISGLLMTATLGLGADMSLKLWGSGAGALSVLSGTLTLLFTSGPLTSEVRQVAGWLVDRLRLPLRFRAGTMLVASLSFFLLALLLRLVALPAWARAYNDRGVTQLAAGELAKAQQSLDRAVSIDPQYAQGYYNLGAAYLDVGDYARAEASFRQALTADRDLDVAYSGLGYALLLQDLPDRAIPIFYGGLALAQDQAAKVALYANLGRAFLDAGRVADAEAALRQALALDPREAAAHCGLGLVAEAQGLAPAEALAHWEACLSYADPATARGLELADLARTRLQDLGGGH